MAIKDPFLVEEENLPEPSEPPALAIVGSVDYESGVTLIFPGAQGESAKYYKCNATVKLSPGQRVRIEKISGSFVAAYPIGPPAREIVADSADAIAGYTVAADAEGALIFRDADATQVPVALAALANEAAHALAADTAQDAVTLGGKEEADLEVARAEEADTAANAELLNNKAEGELNVASAQTAASADLASAVRAYTRAGGHYVELRQAGSSSQNLVGLIGDNDTTNKTFVMMDPAAPSCSFYGTLHELSSRRKKKNIRTLSDRQAEKLLALRPTRYDYRKGASDRMGLIAEEVAAVFPGVSDGQTVEYTQLIAPMIRLLQMQQQRLAALEEKLTEMEAANGRTKPDVRQ